MDIKEIKQIITIFNRTDLSYLSCKSKDFNLTLSSNQLTNEDNSTSYGEISCTLDKQPVEDNHKTKNKLNTKMIYSEYVGKITLINKKASNPYISINQHVSKGELLAFIEMLNLKIEVYAPNNGVISNIFIENDQFVEYGTKLFELLITD